MLNHFQFWLIARAHTPLAAFLEVMSPSELKNFLETVNVNSDDIFGDFSCGNNSQRPESIIYYLLQKLPVLYYLQLMEIFCNSTYA